MGKKNQVVTKPRKLEILFDEKARRDYLTGFSKRKQERRKFGLAMQKLKDRKSKLQVRQQIREAAEEALPGGAMDLMGKEKEETVIAPVEVVEFEDGFTKTHFGESVTVKTFLGIPGSEEEVREEQFEKQKKEKQKRKGVDEEQMMAGSIKKFKRLVGANLPSKKPKTKPNTSGSFELKKLKKENTATTKGKKSGKGGKRR